VTIVARDGAVRVTGDGPAVNRAAELIGTLTEAATRGRTVSRTRVTSQGRVMPWTAPELAALPEAPEERAQ